MKPENGNHSKIEHGAIIEDGAVIGSHCFIGYYSIIRPGVVIGDHCEIRCHSYIAENVHIGSHTHIFQYSIIGKGTVVEDKVWIGPGVKICNTRNIAHLRDYPTKMEPVIIKQGARIGTGAIILPGVVIGENALIGAGAVVTGDAPAHSVFFGNPARFIREVPVGERI